MSRRARVLTCQPAATMYHTPKSISIFELRVTHCARMIGVSPVTRIAQEAPSFQWASYMHSLEAIWSSLKIQFWCSQPKDDNVTRVQVLKCLWSRPIMICL